MQIKTMKLKIRTLNRTKQSRLDNLFHLFTECCKFHLDYVLKNKITNISEVHKGCYELARMKFDLSAHFTQQARDKSISSYKSYLSRRKKDKRANFPNFRKQLPLRLEVCDFRIKDDMLRIFTMQGYLWLPLIIPNKIRPKISNCKFGISEIVKKGGDYYLMLAVKYEDVPVPNNANQPVFGLDLGLANIAVLAGPKVIKFFNGKKLRHIRNKFLDYRRELQKKCKVGMVKRSKGRESNWVRDVNHKISRQVVDIVAENNGVLCVENLRGIRERIKATKKINRMIQGWSFHQLLSFIKYKALSAGVLVVEVDPRYTSQMCSKCGHVHKKNRKSQSDFHCVKCSYEVHADLNAARNISVKGTCSLNLGCKSQPLNGESNSYGAISGNHNP